MSTISTTTHRTAGLNLFIALAIVSVVVLAFTLAPALTSSKSTIIPVTGNQNAYVDFLLGEKAMYTESVRLSDAFSAYHIGEQTVYGVAVNSDNPLTTWRLGEQTIVQFDTTEAALLMWRQGEKNVK